MSRERISSWGDSLVGLGLIVGSAVGATIGFTLAGGAGLALGGTFGAAGGVVLGAIARNLYGKRRI